MFNLKSKLFLGAIFITAGCGHYIKGVAPEMMAPGPVANFTVAPMTDGLLFAFESSPQDVRGKGLKSLEGYNLYRKELASEETSIFKREGYELVKTIADDSLRVRNTLQDRARAEGKNPSNVEVPAKYRTFSYKDTSIERGKKYSYRLVGFNQGGVEAEVDRVVRVEYDGDNSKIDSLR